MNKKILGGAVTAVIGMVGVFAYAQAVPAGGAPPRYLPYVGHLDHDGSPVTGKVAMKVCLVTNQATACDAATWVEEFDSVDVAGGNFSLTLGQTTAIPDGIYNNAALYIRAMVGATAAQGKPTFVQLSGAQRVLSVPYAINVNQASDLHVDGPVHSGSIVPPPMVGGAKEIGLYNETPSAGLRLVTSGGPVTVSVDGNSGNSYAPAGTQMLTVGTNGVYLGDNAAPIRQITTCHSVGEQIIAGPNKAYAFTAGECDHGPPNGTCFGMLGRMAECGGGVNWSVVVPAEGDPVIGSSGGLRWYNGADCEPTSHHDFTVTYMCSH